MPPPTVNSDIGQGPQTALSNVYDPRSTREVSCRQLHTFLVYLASERGLAENTAARVIARDLEDLDDFFTESKLSPLTGGCGGNIAAICAINLAVGNRLRLSPGGWLLSGCSLNI